MTDIGGGLAEVNISDYRAEWEDADTLLLKQAPWKFWKNDIAVRLTGIDAPEVAHPGDPTEWFRFRQEQPMGRWATEQVKALTEGQDLRVTVASDPSKKTYGRYLGVVRRGGEKEPLNIELVRKGIVAALPFGESGSDILPRSRLMQEEKRAIFTAQGIWSHPFFQRYLEISQGVGGRLTFNTFTDLSRLANNLHLASAQQYLFRGGDVGGREIGRKLRPSYGRFFSGKDDSYNTITGLPHGGLAEAMRRRLTDFGSGYVGSLSSEEMVTRHLEDQRVSEQEWGELVGLMRRAADERLVVELVNAVKIRRALKQYIKWQDPAHRDEITATLEEAPMLGLGGVYRPEENQLQVFSRLDPNRFLGSALSPEPTYVTIHPQKITGSAIHEMLHAVWDLEVPEEEKEVFRQYAMQGEGDIKTLARKSPLYAMNIARTSSDQKVQDLVANELFAHLGEEMVIQDPWHVFKGSDRTREIVSQYLNLNPSLPLQISSFSVEQFQRNIQLAEVLIARAKASRRPPPQGIPINVFSGFGREYNTIEGLSHGGLAQGIRQEMTEFGSSWDPRRAIARVLYGEGEAAFNKFLASSTFREAIQRGKVTKELGRGYYGAAHLVESYIDVGGKKHPFQFVKKTILPHRLNEVSEADVLLEARALRAVQDLNAPSFYGIDRKSKTLYMEYLENKPLLEFLTEGGQLTGRHLAGLSHTLSKAAERGFGHLDIGQTLATGRTLPSGNIGVTPKGDLIVLDWGLTLALRRSRGFFGEDPANKEFVAALAKEAGVRFSGFDDAYNTIEGLGHKGIAWKLRKELTDFGSGFTSRLLKLVGKDPSKAAEWVEETFYRVHGKRGAQKAGQFLQKVSEYLGGKEIELNPELPLFHQLGYQSSPLKGTSLLPYKRPGRPGSTRLYFDYGGTSYYPRLPQDPLYRDKPMFQFSVADIKTYIHGKVRIDEEIGDFFFQKIQSNTVKLGGWSIPIFIDEAKGAVPLSLGRIPGFDDAYNLIEGLRHGGLAEQMRRGMTEFGSGWDPLRAIARKLFGKGEGAFQKYIGSKGFQEALSRGKMVRNLGEGTYGRAELMETFIPTKGLFGRQKMAKFRYVRKSILPGMGRTSEEIAQEVADESAAMVALQHANTPTLYGASEKEILMEYFKGESVGGLIRRGVRLGEEHIETVREVLAGAEAKGFALADVTRFFGADTRFTPENMRKLARGEIEINLHNIIYTEEGRLGFIDLGHTSYSLARKVARKRAARAAAEGVDIERVRGSLSTGNVGVIDPDIIASALRRQGGGLSDNALILLRRDPARRASLPRQKHRLAEVANRLRRQMGKISHNAIRGGRKHTKYTSSGAMRSAPQFEDFPMLNTTTG